MLHSLEYDDAYVPSLALTPEQRLFVAIVRRSVWDFVLYRRSELPEKRALAEEARLWLFWNGEEDMDDHGRITFVYACEMLGIDAAELREGVRRLKRTDIQRLNNNLKID